MHSSTVTMFLFILALAYSAFSAPWQPDEYPISYWYGPPPEANNLQTWQTVKDCNFTVCGPGTGGSIEGTRKMLDYWQQLGLRGIVHDGRITWEMTMRDNWRDTIASVVHDYGSHPGLYGYFLQDEPNYTQFAALGQISQELERLDPAHLPYINLFPTYATVQQLGTPTYADHLGKYLSIVKPRVLSYDHYCLMKDGSDRPDYFENLELIREYGLRYATPPWNIILSLPHLGYRDPTASEMRWQVYTSLAYGMKGLMYFTYWTHPDWEKNGEIAIVNSQGKPARLYPIIQQLNSEIRVLGKILLGLKSTGIYHTGDIPPGCRRLGGDAIIALPANAPLLVGLFENTEGAQYAMIVNRNYREPAEIEVVLKPHVVRMLAISPRDASETPLTLNNHRFKLTLEPGGGQLYRTETKFSYAEPPQPLTSIEFRFDQEGDLEGWGGFNSLAEPRVSGGALSLMFSGNDPFLIRPFLRIEANRYSKIRVRMRLSGGNPEGQLFWTTDKEPAFADDKYLNFPVTPDGEWHEYVIPVGTHAKWKGQKIRAIRLDPTTGGALVGSRVDIDFIIGE